MRLDDINAFIDARRVYARAYGRMMGHQLDDQVVMESAKDFTKAAQLCDRPIKRMDWDGGKGKTLSFDYRGVEFKLFKVAN